MDEAMAIFYRYINNLENNWYFMDMFNYRRIFWFYPARMKGFQECLSNRKRGNPFFLSYDIWSYPQVLARGLLIQPFELSKIRQYVEGCHKRMTGHCKFQEVQTAETASEFSPRCIKSSSNSQLDSGSSRSVTCDDRWLGSPLGLVLLCLFVSAVALQVNFTCHCLNINIYYVYKWL